MMCDQIIKCGLLGKSLKHSMSPQIHAGLGDYEYQLFEKSSEEEAKDFILNGDYNAINVTIPYKKLAFRLCHNVSELASKLKNVNVLKKDRKTKLIFGDNTDAPGFKKLLDELKLDITGKNCIVLGSGGAGQTVKFVLNESDAKQVQIISRSNPKFNYTNLHLVKDVEIIVNTTPKGMFPNIDDQPLDLTKFKKCIAVVDLIYNPNPTKLLKQAKDLGIPCIGGMLMLEEQARLASRYMKTL